MATNRDEFLASIKEKIKALHELAIESISDEELAAALAFFRTRQLSGRPLAYDDGATFLLLQAVRKLRNSIPIEPGDSPFEYRK